MTPWKISLAAKSQFGDDLPWGLRTQTLLLMLKHHLWWKAIAPAEEDVYFWEKMEPALPNLARSADELAAAVERTGYSDPESMRAAITCVRQALSLEEIVSEPKSHV